MLTAELLGLALEEVDLSVLEGVLKVVIPKKAEAVAPSRKIDTEK
ncbi:hypothetical protein [Oricola sp.]|nr:hypothetical protein [Oricola sp.]